MDYSDRATSIDATPSLQHVFEEMCCVARSLDGIGAIVGSNESPAASGLTAVNHDQTALPTGREVGRGGAAGVVWSRRVTIGEVSAEGRCSQSPHVCPACWRTGEEDEGEKETSIHGIGER